MLPRKLNRPTCGLVCGTLVMMLLLVPAISFACPTCFASSSANGLRAYYLSTVLLSAMPFLMIGLIATIVYAVMRRQSPQSDNSVDQMRNREMKS